MSWFEPQEIKAALDATSADLYFSNLREQNPGCMMLGDRVTGIADGHFADSKFGPRLSYHCRGCETVFSEATPTMNFNPDGRCNCRLVENPLVWEGDNS